MKFNTCFSCIKNESQQLFHLRLGLLTLRNFELESECFHMVLKTMIYCTLLSCYVCFVWKCFIRKSVWYFELTPKCILIFFREDSPTTLTGKVNQLEVILRQLQTDLRKVKKKMYSLISDSLNEDTVEFLSRNYTLAYMLYESYTHVVQAALAIRSNVESAYSKQGN